MGETHQSLRNRVISSPHTWVKETLPNFWENLMCIDVVQAGLVLSDAPAKGPLSTAIREGEDGIPSSHILAGVPHTVDIIVG